MDYKEVTLETLNMGAARELFDEAWDRLLENIADENTKATAIRSLTISIKVKPSDARDSATTTVSVKENLAPLNPHEHFIYLSTNGNRMQAYTVDPKQPVLEDENGVKITDFRQSVGEGR